jgi:hypothetical protein
MYLHICIPITYVYIHTYVHTLPIHVFIYKLSTHIYTGGSSGKVVIEVKLERTLKCIYIYTYLHICVYILYMHIYKQVDADDVNLNK